ncbi:MAG TPA: hypothetical protein VMR62_09770 [Bryobacteraceae bacterium]|nr:hypothetical protein [Bryobacteraceae bacterium]
MKRLNSIIGVATIACAAALAQSSQEAQIVPDKVFFFKTQADSTANVKITARLGLLGQTVKGAPYSADGATETTQTLADGTHINHQENYGIYRDGDGRVRRESGDQVWISDPVANVSYVLDTKQQTARKLSLSISLKKGPEELAHEMKLKAEAKASGPIWFSTGAVGGGMVVGGPTMGGPMTGTAISTDAAPKPEALGKQEMEGVEVEGTRTTTLIPQGQIGNDRPLQIVHERWESPELHVTIYSKHTDPMMGEIVERLTNVRRGEPDPALFQVPVGYKMESMASVESDR